LRREHGGKVHLGPAGQQDLLSLGLQARPGATHLARDHEAAGNNDDDHEATQYRYVALVDLSHLLPSYALATVVCRR